MLYSFTARKCRRLDNSWPSSTTYDTRHIVRRVCSIQETVTASALGFQLKSSDIRRCKIGIQSRVNRAVLSSCHCHENRWKESRQRWRRAGGRLQQLCAATVGAAAAAISCCYYVLPDSILSPTFVCAVLVQWMA